MTEQVTYDEVRAAEGIARETVDDYTDADVNRIIAAGRRGILRACEICGAELWPTADAPWHYIDEDCRAVRR